MALLLAALALSACQDSAVPDSAETAEGPAREYLSKAIASYRGLTPHEIENGLYKLELSSTTSVAAGLEIGQELGLNASHILLSSNLGGNGGVALSDSVQTSSEAVDSSMHGAINVIVDGLTVRLVSLREQAATKGDASASKLAMAIETELARYEAITFAATGFQIVADPEAVARLQDSEAVRAVTRVELFDHEVQAADAGARSATDYLFEPDRHWVTVTTTGGNRSFLWLGYWATQERLDALHDGARPAFEPDIKLKFRTFLGFPTQGWAEPNPIANAISWYGSFANSYIDTQTSDMANRTYCVGTTSPELVLLEDIEGTSIVASPWNAEDAYVRQLEFSLQHFTAHLLGCEADTWCVGLPGSGKEEALLTPMGEYTVPFQWMY